MPKHPASSERVVSAAVIGSLACGPSAACTAPPDRHGMLVGTDSSLPISHLAFVPLLDGLILGVAAPSLAVFRTMLVTLTKDIPTGSGRPNVLFPILLLGWDKSDVADVALSDISASTARYSVRHLDWPHSLYWPRG